MPQRFENKVAVITGGNSGIGLATAQRFVDEGAFVYITGRRQAELDAAVQQLGGAEHAAGVRGDVAVEADIDALYERVGRERGVVDVVFANAGAGSFAALGEITAEHFDREFAVNVRGVLFTVQKALPLMRAGGSVVLNASIAATRALPAFSVYCATKAAVRSFARGWSVDLKGRGIRVNVVSPGPITTPAIVNLVGGQENVASFEEQMGAGTPAERVGRAEEVAALVAFLASDESSYVYGADFAVDGGYAQV